MLEILKKEIFDVNLDQETHQNLIESFKKDYFGTWAQLARQELYWQEDFETAYEQKNFPFNKWFLGGKTNLSYNCLDQHSNVKKDKIAFTFVNSQQETQTISFGEIHKKVIQFANYLKKLGVKKGNIITLYMPLSIEAIIAMLAIVRIGAIHSIVFAGFSATALAQRIEDTKSDFLITADKGYRKGKELELLKTALEAHKLFNFKNIILYNRSKSFNFNSIETQNAFLIFDFDDYKKESSENDPIQWLDSEDPCFILYTSGSTGKPKGLLHTTAGYALWAKLTTKWVFDIKDSDQYWCTADIGWITGHSYLVYGPLLNGTSSFFYEDAPDFPHKNIFWDLIEKHKISIFYTAPTAIRTFMKWQAQEAITANLDSLRLLGSVGEPINPKAWQWFYEEIGQSKCPIVDTWWQTETGGIMITSLVGIDDMKPGKAGKALPGITSFIDEDKFLYINKPFPSLARTIYNDDEKYKSNYWQNKYNAYKAGDSALVDADGYIEIQGRIDDVLNVSGHRLGTAEIESAIIKTANISEAAVVSRKDEITGEAIIVFAVGNSEAKKEDIEKQIKQDIGSFAKPKEIHICSALPKTRSGKIMRRLLKDLANGNLPKGDISTLEDANVIKTLTKLLHN